jgi:hypothetical protein
MCILDVRQGFKGVGIKNFKWFYLTDTYVYIYPWRMFEGPSSTVEPG